MPTDPVTAFVKRLRIERRAWKTDCGILLDLVEAGQQMASFTGHNPYCKLEWDRLECSERNEVAPLNHSGGSPPCDDQHGPCDCGYDAWQRAVEKLGRRDGKAT